MKITLATALPAFLVLAPVAQALTINPTFDSTVTGSRYAAQIESGFNTAAAVFTNNVSSNISVNIQVSWGFIAGQSMGAYGLGASSGYYYQGIPGSSIQYWLTAAASSPNATVAEKTSVKYLPAAVKADSNYKFMLPTAQAKALGLVNPVSGLDGYIGFGSGLNYTFSGTTIASGTYDFVAVAQHEIEEILGRVSGVSSTNTTYLSPFDLFRYTAPGVSSTSYSAPAYFSIDGGTTRLATFNNASSGDRADLNGATNDVDNAFLHAGQRNNVLQDDFTILDVLGYVSTPGATTTPTPYSTILVVAHQDVPEPATLSLLAAGLIGLGFVVRNRKSRA